MPDVEGMIILRAKRTGAAIAVVAAFALVLSACKMSVLDQFDHLPPSNDPHTGFMSWGLWGSAAYDYPADTRGYT